MNNILICSIENCDNIVRAKKLCNAHYVRQRKGKDMNTPVRRRETNKEKAEGGRTCEITGCSLPHYSFNMCVHHYGKAKHQTRKKELIKLCGDACQDCGQSYSQEVYDFHHRNPDTKNLNIGKSMNVVSMEILIAEVKKCDLLCSNCHRTHHWEKQEITGI